MEQVGHLVFRRIGLRVWALREPLKASTLRFRGFRVETLRGSLLELFRLSIDSFEEEVLVWLELGLSILLYS